MTNALRWLGARSRFWLAASCVIAFALPALSAFLRPALPFFVALLIGIAAARMEPADVARRLANPRHLARLALITFLMIPATAALALTLIGVLGLGDTTATMILIYAVAPPITAAPAICFILGFEAVLALEVMVAATLLTPLLGPAIFSMIDLAPLQLAPFDFFLRLTAMTVGGLVLGVVLRRALGAAWIRDNETAFDGIATIGMALFVIPLFEGVGAMILAQPGLALATMALACFLNFGVNLAVAFATRRTGREVSGALGFLWGNRNLALFLAALPADPVVALFVALYQFPMYFTPLIWDRVGRWLQVTTKP